MDAERARTFLLTLPHVIETMQWGNNLVFWVGDKAIGGKMFALVNLDSGASHGVISYSAGAERFAELVEIDGLKPAPYTARIFWVAADRWDVFRNAEWEAELTAAHRLTCAKLSRGVKSALDLPATQLKQLISERRKMLAEKKQAKSSRPST